MRIKFVEIQNFRKLKACRLELAKQETVLVGANNSGKTSAMDVLMFFLDEQQQNDFATTDFTLSNWLDLDEIGKQWGSETYDRKPDIDLWLPLMPTIDIWLEVDEGDVGRVVHLLPTLDWTLEELVGIRFVYAPKKMEQLYKEFVKTYSLAREREGSFKSGSSSLTLWPKSMKDFLDKKLSGHFKVLTYILDPSNLQDPYQGVANPQLLPSDRYSLGALPIKDLVRVDTIKAQRGFSDPSSEDRSYSGAKRLSKQLGRYFDKHLDPSDTPDDKDMDVLAAIEAAKVVFEKELHERFASAIGELESLNYPGFSDPNIAVTSNIELTDGLNHDKAVQYQVPGIDAHSLPEQCNGLGYQNLISMVFNLRNVCAIHFRRFFAKN